MRTQRDETVARRLELWLCVSARGLTQCSRTVTQMRLHTVAARDDEFVRAAQELTEIGVSLHDDGLVDLASSILSRAALKFVSGGFFGDTLG